MTLKQRWPVLVSASIFISAIMVGWFFHPFEIDPPKIPEHPPFLPIALQNLLIIFFLGVGGLLLGVPTVLVGAWNAFLAGAIFAAVTDEPAWWLALSIHGMPELAGQFCAMVSGLKIAATLIRKITHDTPLRLTSPLRWFGLALGLTLIAVVLECTVSAIVAKAVIR